MSWTLPTSLENVTGYTIYYDSDGGSAGSVRVKDGWTDSYLLTGLQTGVNYSLCMVAQSQHLPSEADIGIKLIYNYYIYYYFNKISSIHTGFAFLSTTTFASPSK